MARSIGLVMIVKDDERLIGRLAQSLRELIDYWVICDTGSTDATPVVVRHVFAGIPGELHHHAWVDDAINYNLALRAARGKTNYLLLLHADESVRLDADLPELTANAYSLRVEDGRPHWSPRLVRGDLHWHYVVGTPERLMLDHRYRAKRLPQLVVRRFAGTSQQPDGSRPEPT